jgi:hypothetical protein
VSISTYPQFLEELNRLLTNEEEAYEQIPSRTLEQIINLGQKRLYRDVRTRYNNKAFSVTVTGNLAAIPSDFRSADVLHFGREALVPATEDELRLLNLAGGGGDTCRFAQAGGSFTFWPAVADGTALQGRYFYALADLSIATLPSNALFAAADDLFMFACLAEAAPLFQDDQRIPLWNAKYLAIKDRLNTDHERAAYSAGRARISPSTRVKR